MPTKNEDLHGMVPDKSTVALVLLDVINDLEFDGADKLLPHALKMADNLAALIGRARKAKIPVVYVNDNYGRWQSDFNKIIDRCLREDVRGKPFVERLRPEEEDYFVLKPKHSGFFSTTLDILLDYLGAKRLIICGIAGNICVLFTANDAYMRDFELFVPEDCVASNTEEINRLAVEQIRDVLKANTSPSGELDLEAMHREAPSGERSGNAGGSRQFTQRPEPARP